MRRLVDTFRPEGEANILQIPIQHTSQDMSGTGETKPAPFKRAPYIQEDYVTRKLRWTGNYSIGRSTGAISKSCFRVNSIFDPCITQVGNENSTNSFQNRAFNGARQMADNYQYYRVMANKVTINFVRVMQQRKSTLASTSAFTPYSGDATIQPGGISGGSSTLPYPSWTSSNDAQMQAAQATHSEAIRNLCWRIEENVGNVATNLQNVNENLKTLADQSRLDAEVNSIIACGLAVDPGNQWGTNASMVDHWQKFNIARYNDISFIGPGKHIAKFEFTYTPNDWNSGIAIEQQETIWTEIDKNPLRPDFFTIFSQPVLNTTQDYPCSELLVFVQMDAIVQFREWSYRIKRNMYIPDDRDTTGNDTSITPSANWAAATSTDYDDNAIKKARHITQAKQPDVET